MWWVLEKKEEERTSAGRRNLISKDCLVCGNLSDLQGVPEVQEDGVVAHKVLLKEV